MSFKCGALPVLTNRPITATLVSSVPANSVPVEMRVGTEASFKAQVWVRHLAQEIGGAISPVAEDWCSPSQGKRPVLRG